jgi:PAS domain S-box-containing protein
MNSMKSVGTREGANEFQREIVDPASPSSASVVDPSTLLEAMLGNTLDLIYFKDLQSRYLRYSRSFSLHFGFFGSDALVGKRDLDLFPEERAKALFEEEQRIIRTGEPVIGKLEQATRADGQERWFLTTKMPWRGPSGDILGTFGVCKDVTELREAEAKVAETGSLLDILLENSPDCIYFKDRKSRFIHFSKAFKDLFKIGDAAKLRGKTDFDFFTEEHARPAYEDEQEIIRSGKPLVGKLEKETHPDGRVTWCLTTKMAWRNKAGKIIGTFGTSKDVTVIKDAEARVDQMHRQLMESSRVAGMAEVATSVLHNVGNVLNSVNVAAQLIKEKLESSRVSSLLKATALLQEHSGDLPGFLTGDAKGKQLPGFIAEVAQCLAGERQSILTEVQELNKKIDHIKDIVAMQQSYASVSGVVETVKVSELAEDALRMNAGALSRHNVQVVRQYDPQTPEISVDKHKVLQILVNLIRNAKYACDESNRPDKQLTVRIQGDPERIRITVLDNGIGIPLENMNRIFNHGFTTRKDGHGFGLHSGALAAKELGGNLLAHSDGPGTGASFTLELPREPVTPEPAATRDHQPG